MKYFLHIAIWLFSVSITAQNLSLFKKETFKDDSGNTLLYRTLYPKNYDRKKSYPLLLFLHGAGERGNDNEKQLTHISNLLLDEREKGESEAIVILPQCPENEMWAAAELRENMRARTNLYIDHHYPLSPNMQLVSKLLDKMLALPEVNEKQVSIMGLSMGAYGTFDLLSHRPNTFVKAVPICGGGNYEVAKRYVPFTSIKIFHGADDNIVNPDLSRAMYDRLKALGADVSYKEYPNVKHDSWHNAFEEQGLMKWITTPPSIQKYNFIENISYSDPNSNDEYINERCKLDIYYPTNKKDFPTVVWFHGGGLEGGEKHIPDNLKNQGIAVIGVNYRLNPRANAPAYIEDAAASIAWAFKNIEKYGGSTKDIYVSGHSAGGYLTLMAGLDKSYLAKHDIDADSIKGLIPISGQTNTHYTIRKERNIPMDIPIIDHYGPLNLVRENVVPTLLITGDRELEMTARFEENIHLEAMLKAKGNKNVKLYELEGFDHGTVYPPGCLLVLEWIKKWSK